MMHGGRIGGKLFSFVVGGVRALREAEGAFGTESELYGEGAFGVEAPLSVKMEAEGAFGAQDELQAEGAFGVLAP